MSLHKLSAGDGYAYLTRQVAAMDSTERGHGGLGDYYSTRGESPGIWAGAGLAGLQGVEPGQPVSEEQMQALFGHGRHPNAAALERAAAASGRDRGEAAAAAALGRAFPVFATAADGFRARCAAEFGAVNAAAGLPAGAPVPADERARIRTEVGRAMFAEVHGRLPVDARELSGFIARASRPATTAVAGYDLTFSPVKSVSALWALAPREIAQRVETAHQAAVADTLSWLEKEACFTRTGTAGIRQVETTGFIAATFTHRDSRAGDPELHTHVAVSNKVQTRDGKWLALDGRVLHKANVAASERYNTRLEAHLVAGLGVAFADRSGTEAGKRPVREIVGVDARLLTAWSARRRAINARRGDLAAVFEADHGRPPTAVEAIGLAQQATLETRDTKHEPRSLGQQREAWRREASGLIGGPPGIARMLDRVLAPHRPTPSPRATDTWVRKAAERLLETVSGQRATWQFWHVQAEAERVVRGAGIAPNDVDTAVTLLASEALSPGRSMPLGDRDPVEEPAELRRIDGASVYTVAGSRLYTSQAVLDAEHLLVAAAGRTDGRRAEPTAVEWALLESAANGVVLNPGQAHLVRQLATSGTRLQLALAPAGSGKTTALAVLSRAWTDGGGTVVGLAPTAVAAAGLGQQLVGHCDTLAKLTWHLRTDGQLSGAVPGWISGIGPGTMVIVDEAGMAGTVDLATAVDFVLGRGGSVRLVGDDQQLAAVAAGGALRDIADTHGATTLSQLTRFHDPAEGAATLAIRAGETAGLGFYLDHGRVHVGDEATAADQAYAAWAADHTAGVNAVMLAPTRELVAGLNARARADRLTATGTPAGREVELADGNRASTGDLLVSRRNDRALPITRTDWVKNGDRWTVTKVHRSGAITAAHAGTGRRVTLPAAYVREHVGLGYASTVHGAQGITADTCHTVVTGTETRQLLYVAVTRGRGANHLYVTTAGDGDPHAIITPHAVRPPTATDLLTAALARDGAPRSAASTGRELTDPATRLQDAAARYRDALGVAAETALGPAGIAALDAAAEQVRPGLSQAPGWRTLRDRLALLAVAGHDPITALRQAAGGRELDSAADPAAVLDWRLDPTSGQDRPAGPLPWLPAVLAALAGHPEWGPYLAARAGHVTSHAGRVIEEAATWTPTTAPAWAARLTETEHAGLRGQLAVWRAATGVPPADRRPTGPPQLAAAERRHQRRLDAAVTTVLGAAGAAARSWAAVADSIDPRISHDEHWTDLADRLTTADRAGIDVASLLIAVTGERPLPDDLPAAALWWRLSAHLSPAALTSDGLDAATLHPAWIAALGDAVTPERAQRVVADPAWPALVAAVTTGTRGGWDPAELITAAASGLPQRGGPRMPSGDLAAALVFRVSMLTDPTPVTVDEPLPADLRPPDDVHLLAPAADPETATVIDRWPTGALDVDVEPPFDPDFDRVPPDTADDTAPRDRGLPYVTPDPFARNETPGDSDPADYLLEEHFWATATVGRQRLIELNQQAVEYFADRYPDSWAPAYLQSRLGTDLTGDTRFSPGYAPAGWTTLTDHLRSDGATDEEILAAGLGVRARTGRVIDRFRDRLTFPIHGPDGAVHGFIGRRNPARDDAGPKYLNTAGTDLFSKGAQLFGLHEGGDALAAGAAPVLVEGPLDAIATTLAGDCTYVGVATLGTAFNDRQADQLLPYLGGRSGIVVATIVATDADTAGQQAAERSYWQLAARGDDPRRLPMSEGYDPADILSTGGPGALRELLDESGSLAEHLIDRMITATPADPVGAATTIHAAAEIIAALPPTRWLHHADRVTAALQKAPGSVHQAVLNADHARKLDPAGQTQAGRRTTAYDLLPTPKSVFEPPVPLPIQQNYPATASTPDRRSDGHDSPPSLSKDRDRPTGMER
ncbi:MobF family relaxase [Blastococcus colisei]|nr:MobF family relaxase [Blastococcus colisei]